MQTTQLLARTQWAALPVVLVLLFGQAIAQTTQHLHSPLSASLVSQAPQRPPLTEEHKRINVRLGALRSVPDDKRGEETKQIALEIRRLPESGVRVELASGLANLATEGDFGQQTLQEVTTTLAEALKQEPVHDSAENPADPYVTLAQLVRYEHTTAALSDPQFTAALKKLEEDDSARAKADFTLADLKDTPWTLKSLKGKVVLVNFWATWCPPCRKELPDLERLAKRFQDKGLVVLGITDEAKTTVTSYVAAHAISYPVLLDSGRKVNTRFRVSGIPRTLIYDRNGKLVAEAIDMRTEHQLLALLAKAGIE